MVHKVLCEQVSGVVITPDLSVDESLPRHHIPGLSPHGVNGKYCMNLATCGGDVEIQHELIICSYESLLTARACMQQRQKLADLNPVAR